MSNLQNWSAIDDRAVAHARALAMDAVQNAGHGHPGTAMSLAPVAYNLFQRHLVHDPADPKWLGRDRFVLSCGHSSLTLYTQLFFSGYGLELEDLKSILDSQGDEVALLLIGGVNYYTGQYLDIKKITELGHAKDCIVGIDLAHGAGNIQPNLHDSGVDFAAWCTYKYLNSGPGSLSGLFVHEKHAQRKDLPRFAGWWNHNKETRFNMRQPFDVMEGAEGWQLSNPPILSMAAIKASLDIFEKVGMDALVKKSKKLTGFFEYLVNEIASDTIEIITPTNPNERGCQLSLQVKNADKNLHRKLTENNIITDWREPDVIRCAPVPMYTSFEDVYHMVTILESLL